MGQQTITGTGEACVPPASVEEALTQVAPTMYEGGKLEHLGIISSSCNWGSGDQDEFLCVPSKELQDSLSGTTVSPARKAGFLQEGCKKHRANSRRSLLSFPKMQRTTFSGRDLRLTICLEIQV